MNKEYEEKIRNIKQELLIMKILNLKVNCSELSRIYKIDIRTIKNYNNGYCRKNTVIERKSKLDNIKDEVKEKLELPGITVTGLYQYFSKDNNIGTYLNFYKYIKKHKLKPNKNNKE